MMHNTALVGYTFAYGMDSIVFNHTDLSLSFWEKGTKHDFLYTHWWLETAAETTHGTRHGTSS